MMFDASNHSPYRFKLGLTSNTIHDIYHSFEKSHKQNPYKRLNILIKLKLNLRHIAIISALKV